MRGAALLLALGIAGGALLDGRAPAAPLSAGGYVALQADLHVHTFFGDGTLSPLHLLLEARRRGLDAVAVTNHNQVALARFTRALSRLVGGPTVIVGEEVTAPGWHLIGVGLRETVDWKRPLVDAVAAVHAQGGAAILAHPTRRYWPAATDDVLVALDGTEVRHADTSPSSARGRALVALYERGRALHPGLAAIGSSDDHGLGGLGRSRTVVFARGSSEEAIVEAVRAGRTVAVGRGGAYGDPALVALVPARAPSAAPAVTTGAVGLLGWAGVAGLLLLARPRDGA